MQQDPGATPAGRFWRAVQALKLPARLALAVVSGSSYWWVFELADRIWPSTANPFGDLVSPLHLVAVVFGLLVMAPYAAVSRLLPVRVLALCIASVLIYHFAISLVAQGPFSHNTVTPYLISGGGAAVLVGLAVVVLAPQRCRWQLLALTAAAGVLGGSVFRWAPALWSDFEPQAGHVIWQVLVCLALHLGLRAAPRR